VIISNQETLLMPRVRFGAFLAPHDPTGEHAMLQFRRDLDLVEHLDELGYDRAREAVMVKITGNPTAAAALEVTKSPLLAASSANAPDLTQTPDRLASR
jgi:hypothetical protein